MLASTDETLATLKGVNMKTEYPLGSEQIPQIGAEQKSVRCTIMRGGTSKAVFLLEKDMTEVGIAKNKLLMHIIDGYNLHSIDGLGGGSVNTSKIVIVGKSKRTDADVDCQFIQIGTGDKTISYETFCGNICSAVGPYAVDMKLTSYREGLVTIRIFNKNINRIIKSTFHVSKGLSMVHGKNKISGICTPGAPVFLDFSEIIQNGLDTLLPTKKVVNQIVLPSGQVFHVTLLDLVNPTIFIDANELNMNILASAHDLTHQSQLMNTIHQLRKACAGYFDLQNIWANEQGKGPMLPYAIIVGASDNDDITLNIRAVHLKECHPSIPASSAIPTAIATFIPESIPFLASRGCSQQGIIRIGHPQGEMEVEVDAHWDTVQQTIIIKQLGYTRTARRIMDGWVYILK